MKEHRDEPIKSPSDSSMHACQTLPHCCIKLQEHNQGESTKLLRDCIAIVIAPPSLLHRAGPGSMPCTPRTPSRMCMATSSRDTSANNLGSAAVISPQGITAALKEHRNAHIKVNLKQAHCKPGKETTTKSVKAARCKTRHETAQGLKC